mmetsp:Transcript_39244/g.117268  ORF Transcript_39244/g.117268 Transcript_39244/m.117268 type:complete len:200 (+) Transcript_39244:722-1321(+)
MAEKHVLQGDVAVANVQVVEVLQCLQQLPCPAHDLLGHLTALPLEPLADCEEVPAIRVLEHQTDIAAKLERKVHLQDVLGDLLLLGQEAVDADLVLDLLCAARPLHSHELADLLRLPAVELNLTADAFAQDPHARKVPLAREPIKAGQGGVVPQAHVAVTGPGGRGDLLLRLLVIRGRAAAPGGGPLVAVAPGERRCEA